MGFIYIPKDIYDSYYYRWVLNPNDKIVLQNLFSKVLMGNNQYYTNSLLIVNTKIKTLSHNTGLTWDITQRSLTRLDKLGVIIKLKKIFKNNRYFLGFRGKENERLYLLTHLINEKDRFLRDGIKPQLSHKSNKCVNITLPSTDFLSLNKDYREFIIDYIDVPKLLINKRLKDEETIIGLMFGETKIYKELFQ